MKRNAGAQAGEGKLESRFAALTSGLLARKGFAAPSNSPIHDPAEETDAFALEPTHKKNGAKAAAAAPDKKPDTEKAPIRKTQPDPTPVKIAASAPSKAEHEKAASVKAEADKAPAARLAAQTPAGGSGKKPEAAPPIKLQSADRAPATPLTIINERSFEAGYPDNPTPEEIAAIEAEADEVVSYFENFGTEDAVALEKDDFYGAIDDGDDNGDDGGDDIGAEDFDDEDDLDEGAATATAPAPGPWAGGSVPAVAPAPAFDVKAGVTVQLTAREFMRLSLGAAETGQSAQDLIVEAIEDYLDSRGVLSLGGCSCLDALTKPKS